MVLVVWVLLGPNVQNLLHVARKETRLEEAELGQGSIDVLLDQSRDLNVVLTGLSKVFVSRLE